MNERYRHSFVSPAGESWQISVFDTEHTGGVTPFDCFAPGFVLSVEGDGDNRIGFIKASTVKVTALVNDSAFETFINEIIGSLEQRFFVKIYQDDVLYFAGLMLQDLIELPISSFPYAFEMTFSDGIAVLEKIKYDNDGTLFVGRDNFLAHLGKILAKTGIDQLFGASDNYLITQIDWYSTLHSSATDKCPIAYTDVDHRAFQEVDSADYSYTALTCIEVLEMICKVWGAYFFQANGSYRFVSLIISPNVAKTRYFSKYLTLLASGVLDSTVDVSTLHVREGSNAIMRFLPAVLAVKSTHTHKMSVNINNILPSAYAYPTLSYICNVEEIVDGYSDYFRFTGRFDYSGWSTGLSEISIRAVMGFKVQIAGDSNTYYMTNNGGVYGTATKWVLTPEYYKVTLPIDTSSSNFNSSQFVSWDSPQFPVDGEFYFQVELLGYEKLTGYSWIPYTPPAIPSFSFGFACMNFKLIIKQLEYPYATISGGKYEFTATQIVAGTTTPVKASEVIDFGEIPVADGPHTYSVGKMKASADGTTWNDTKYWTRGGSGSGISLSKLRLQEVAIGQLTPVRMVQGAWYHENWNPAVVYKIDSRYFMFNGGSYSPDDCVVSGEWIELRNTPLWSQVNITVKTLSTEYIPNPNQPVGGGTDGGSSYSASEVIANLLRTMVASQALTYITSAIASGTAITAISVNRISAATLRNGDEIMVIDIITGNLESFVLAADQTADAESLSIESKSPSVSIPEGAIVVIAPGEAKKYFNHVPYISRATSDPSSAPAAAGNVYINTTSGIIWIANGTSSLTNWIQIN